ncbi:21986_t:CDS:2, partial [Gigaspora rosea]
DQSQLITNDENSDENSDELDADYEPGTSKQLYQLSHASGGCRLIVPPVNTEGLYSLVKAC